MDYVPTFVDCSVTYVNPLASDRLIIPVPRDSIMFGNQESGPGREIYLGAERKTPERHLLKPYGNNVEIIDLPKGKELKIKFKVPFLPSMPPTDSAFLNQSLSNGENFTKWKVKSPLVDKKVTDKEAIEVIGSFIKRKIIYSKIRDVFETVEDLLLTPDEYHPRVDCLGYHAALVGSARSLGIPAVLDFGFRLTKQDAAHVWAWYFDRDRQTWAGVDLNDHENDVGFGFGEKGRVSMSLGTTYLIQNIPGFTNTTISFLQYCLGRNRIENNPPYTTAQISVDI
jgi:hypothetical protein